MPERRYSKYKFDDVWRQLLRYQQQLGVTLLENSVHGYTVSLVALRAMKGKEQKIREEHRAVILARSSDWYEWSLNNVEAYGHRITCIVCGTHDSCVEMPVLALDSFRWYDTKKMRDDFGPLLPKFDAQKNFIPDLFDTKRKTQYGHNMLIGALMCKREDALARLATFKRSTRLRIEAEVRKLHHRRVGHPFTVY